MNPIVRLLRTWGAAGAAENARRSVGELRRAEEAVARELDRIAVAGRAVVKVEIGSAPGDRPAPRPRRRRHVA